MKQKTKILNLSDAEIAEILRPYTNREWQNGDISLGMARAMMRVRTDRAAIIRLKELEKQGRLMQMPPTLLPNGRISKYVFRPVKK